MKALALLLVLTACAPRTPAERAVAACQRHAAGPIAEMECGATR